MFIKTILDEDFVNYKQCSMLIAFPSCTFKCEQECGKQVCQNSKLATSPNIEIGAKTLVNRYINNQLTSSIVCAGLEPIDSFNDLISFISILRGCCNDTVIIYTGYNKEEILDKVKILQGFKNIIIKFGRFIPDQPCHYDEVLGVELASPNQYAEKIS